MADTLMNKLLRVTEKDCADFLVWYTGNADRDEYEELGLPQPYSYYEEWLTSTEGIECQMIMDKHLKNYKLSLLYNNMMTKALNGDINAAKWIESFVKSDYFKEDADEIEDFLSAISIPGLE